MKFILFTAISCNFDVERENAREAPKLDPFVLALNKRIESIYCYFAL